MDNTGVHFSRFSHFFSLFLKNTFDNKLVK